MVCLGNICRSPIAQGILEDLVKAKKLDWQIDSAGTSGWHSGEAPDHRAIKEALKHGIDIRTQKSRKFYGFDFEEYDMIYAMDKSNYHDILRAAREESEKAKVKLIMDETLDRKGMEVPDPYYDDKGFQVVFQMLKDACEQIIINHSKEKIL